MKWFIDHKLFLPIAILSSLLLINSPVAAFEDDEGCLLCHKYPKMGRITEDGARRSYYVMPHVFGNTVHRNVPCTDCHTYIKQLPHREVKEGVKCNSECHSVKNPATGKNFSHKPIYEKYKQSSHFRPKLASGHDQDKPYCVTCHRNPVYNPKEFEPPKRITDRCVICHEDEEFVKDWYKHTSRRINEVRRSSAEIIQLCSTCHGDKRLVERHLEAARKEGRQLGRKYEDAVESYQASFHGKVTKYGFTKAANCLDCHADATNYFLNVHLLRPSRNIMSPVHKDQRLRTCKRCHENADENYAQLDPHPSKKLKDNPFAYYADLAYGWVGDVVFVLLIALAAFETVGRWRDGVCWRMRHGSSWAMRRGKRGRDRVI